jgi:DnaK suppressor protein
VSKTPAKQATTKKPAAKVPAKAAHAKPAAKVAAKPAATKAAAKPAATHKPAATAHKPAPAPKAAPAKTSAKPAAAKPAAHAAPAHPPKAAHHPEPAAVAHAPAPAPAKAPAPPAAPKPAPKASSRSHPAAPAAAPLPPPTSRFADRFAPPRPPTRQMNNLAVDIQKTTHKSDPKLANAWKTKAGKDLSEAELLAMPDSEYMNDKQLEFFRGRLQTLKDDLLSNAGETTEHLREDTSIVPDPADRATIEEEHALELRTRDRERKLLKKISQSLARIDAGDYGFCDETGEPIGLGRLIARPTATLSLEAQQRRELKQKMFGD